MESVALINDKYYMNFIPTKSAQAIHKAGSRLYHCEDMLILGKLGNGYFASVFLVHHRPTNQFLAMKLTKEPSTQMREIELLSRLSHDNVVKLYGSCVIGARFACLTELANGGNLADLLSETRLDLSWPIRIGLALDIAKGLHHLHSNNLIHRDLSSVNIFIRIDLSNSYRSENGNCKNTFGPRQPDYSSLIGHSLDVPKTPFLRACFNAPQTIMNTPESLLSEESMHRDFHPVDLDFCTRKSTERKTMGDAAFRTPHDDDDNTNGHTDQLFILPVVHPVWKSKVLMHPDFVPHYTAVVADLGLCLDISQENANVTPLVGNPYYIAPERLSGIAPYTFAADVFSYGVVLCELITRIVNDGNGIPRTEDFGLDHAKLQVPHGCPRWFLGVALDACGIDYNKRPTLGVLISRFKAHRGDTTARDLPGSTNCDPAYLTKSAPVTSYTGSKAVAQTPLADMKHFV